MGKELVTLREINKKNILGLVIKSGPISRIDVSRMLKISRPTVSSYINDLIDDGLLVESGKTVSAPSGGKRAVLVKFNNKAGYIFSVMIGVKNTRIAVTDLNINIIHQIKIPTKETKGSQYIIGKIIEEIKSMISKNKIAKSKIIGIGIGCSGLVNSEEGVVIFSPNLKGWKNIRLKEILKKQINLEIFLDNECRLQCLAEKSFGLARNINNFICVETGTGIGTGVVVNNNLVSGGTTGIAGEIGHIITDIKSKKKCHCGDIGCLETLCSLPALMDKIINDLKNKKSIKIKSGDLDFEKVCDMYLVGNKTVKKHVDENAYFLGVGISNAIKFFNPEKIIIHGPFIRFGDRYLNIINNTVIQNTFPEAGYEYSIEFSGLGENVGIIGAATMVFEKAFFNNKNLADTYLVKKL